MEPTSQSQGLVTASGTKQRRGVENRKERHVDVDDNGGESDVIVGEGKGGQAEGKGTGTGTGPGTGRERGEAERGGGDDGQVTKGDKEELNSSSVAFAFALPVTIPTTADTDTTFVGETETSETSKSAAQAPERQQQRQRQRQRQRQTQQQQQPPRRGILTRFERNDLQGALGHIITVGSALRHRHWRIHEWQRKLAAKGKADLGSASASASAVTEGGRKKAQEIEREHGEEEDDDASLPIRSLEFNNDARLRWPSLEDNDELQEKQRSSGSGSGSGNGDISSDEADAQPDKKRRVDIAKFDEYSEAAGRDFELVHAQDLRLYGQNGFPATPWEGTVPAAAAAAAAATSTSKETEAEAEAEAYTDNAAAAVDETWHEECSDWIHPLAFCDSKRSSRMQPPDEVADKNADDADAHSDADADADSDSDSYVDDAHSDADDAHSDADDAHSDADAEADSDADAEAEAIFSSHRQHDPHTEGCCDMNPADVPRALLLRCWDRAVHASSSTLQVDADADAADGDGDGAGGGRREWTDQERQLQQGCSYSPDEAKEACRNLGTALDQGSQEGSAGTNGRFLCPVCHAIFDSLLGLDEHFYGTKTRRGCCWIRIKVKRRAVMEQALLAEVKQHTRQVISCIMSETERSSSSSDGHRQGTNDGPPIKDWRHVLGALEQALANATPAVNAGGISSVTDTVLLDPETTPIVLNPLLLRNISDRLMIRYAKVAK